jgi:hypothetical protein
VRITDRELFDLIKHKASKLKWIDNGDVLFIGPEKAIKNKIIDPLGRIKDLIEELEDRHLEALRGEK